MKKVIGIFIMLCSLLLSADVSDVASALSTVATNTSNITSDTTSKIIADNQAQKVLNESSQNSVQIKDLESSSVKNNVDDKGEKIQSLYTQYFLKGSRDSVDNQLFGINIINNAKDISVPVSINDNYLLASGDSLNIKIWNSAYSVESSAYSVESKDSNTVMSIEISKTGTIFIPNIGSFYANNKTIASLQNEILVEGKKKLKYFNVELTLEKLREVSIFVTGEVNRPGQVLTTPYNNILNILNKAEGVTSKASLRNIKILRGSQEILIDLYSYFLGNKNTDDLKLKDGDTLIIPVVKDLIYISGEVNRPGIYEINQELYLKSYNL